MKRLTQFLISMLLLSSCATPALYQPSSEGNAGYRERKLDHNKYRIVFTGNNVTPREIVEIYLLYRAAEVTLENSYEYFLVNEQQMDTKTSYYSSAPAFYSSYGVGRRRYAFPYYASGYSWAASSGVQTQDRYEAIAYITLYKDKAKEEKPEFYNAREVLENLGPSIQRTK
jgi:hypothetical protein